jgi:hypothetical protein
MQDQLIAHPGSEVVMLGVPKWLCDRLLPGSLDLSRVASRELPFDQQGTYIAGWLGQALAAQVERVEAEYAEQDEEAERQDEEAERRLPAFLFAIRRLCLDGDPRPTVCALEEESLTGANAEVRTLAQAAAEIIATVWLDPGPDVSPTPNPPPARGVIVMSAITSIACWAVFVILIGYGRCER